MQNGPPKASSRETALRLALRLSPKRLAPKVHQHLERRLDPDWYKDLVGGMWDEIGRLQFDFLVNQGLQPNHHFLDVGCGSLRGGLHFIRYLEPGHYFGVDISERLLRAGERELEAAGLTDKDATLLKDGAFRFSRFGRTFDFALAQSVFSHLPFNVIMRCLTEIEPVLGPGGRFYATFFANPGPRLRVDEIYTTKPDGGRWPWPVRPDADPFYYDPDIFRWAVEGSTLDCTLLGEWDHPKQQQILVFTKKDRTEGT